MEHLLETKNISKIFRREGTQQEIVLNEVSLQVAKGEFISVMGASGSGKSTLLHCLSSMDAASSGTVLFDGVDLSSLNDKQQAKMRLNKMGFIFQQNYLMKNLSILDNITLPAYAANRENMKVIESRARELMDRAGIGHLADRDITQASGGQLQRVSICRALINRPDMLFADEPTGALNSRSTQDIIEILLEINRLGVTIFLVTHDVKVACKADRVLYMLDGRIIAECQLGKYKAIDAENGHREKVVSEWLSSMGF